MACSDNQWKRGGELLRESLRLSWQNKRLWFVTLFPAVAFFLSLFFEVLVLKFLFGLEARSYLYVLFLILPIAIYGLILLANFFYALAIAEGNKQSYKNSFKCAWSRVRHPFFLLFALFSVFEFVLPLFLLLGFLIIPFLIVVAFSDFSVKESLIDYEEVFDGSSGIVWSIVFKIFSYFLYLNYSKI